MSNVVNQIVDDIVKDTTKTLNNATRYVANRTADDWEQKAKSVMDAYYSTETAGYYERTLSLRDTVNKIFKKNNGGYIAGVMFDPSRMSHDGLSQFSEFAIMDNFMYGQHGNEDYTIPKTGKQITRNISFTTPYARITLDKYYQNYDSKVDQYFEEAFRIFGS
jgi:hypothetical protein